MNKFDAGAMKTLTGWIAFYRQVSHSRNFILRDGKHDIIFATQAEAKEAAWAAFLDYLNSPIVAESLTGPTTKRAAAKKAGDAIFKKGNRIPVERIGA
jgi:hypothetical protein